MRVHAGGREQYLRMRSRELHGSGAARQAGARDDHLGHAGGARTLDHGLAIAVKTVMRQIGADVDPLHARYCNVKSSMPDMMPAACRTLQHNLKQLSLWDAEHTEQSWSVRQSARARRLSVRVFRHGGVEIVVPPRTSPQRVSAFVSEHREWIERQRTRSAPALHWPLPPATLCLSAVGEHWRCQQQPRHWTGAGA